MTYYVNTYTADGVGIECRVNVRSNANHKTKVMRWLQSLYDELHRLGLIEDRAKVTWERPNLSNGCVGFLTLSDSKHSYIVSVSDGNIYMYL